MAVDQYDAEVNCEVRTAGGNIEQVWPVDVNSQTILQFVAAFFPAIRKNIESVSEIRLTLKVRER